MKIRNELRKMADASYKDFQSKLVPTVDPETILGVRTPQLRNFAKQLMQDGRARSFINELPHRYYDENNLHAFIIAQIKDFASCVEAVDRFLPFVDNWATCDSLRPKCFGKNRGKLLPYIQCWLASTETYTIRFGIEMLMVHYLDDDFEPEYLKMVAKVDHQDYYVKMMIAWYFATALAKQWEESIKYLENRNLSGWVHNKTIQKAVESSRITAKQKGYLKKLKR